MLPLGIRGANPIWAEFDLAGHIFDDNFYMWVLENTLPYIPATVYHDPNLNVPWDNPIQFLANGTLPIDIFFEPGHLYRLEFRQNDGLTPPTQNDPLIYEVNNYLAGGDGDVPPEDIGFASENQVTNPQFSIVNFNSPYQISASNPDIFEIAPGWLVQLVGTGLFTVELSPLNNVSINPSNAPYALHIQTSGWNTDGVVLIQRLPQNGMLWGNKFVSTAITARVNGLNQVIKAKLQSSNGTPIAPSLLPSTAVIQNWVEYKGHAQLNTSDNPDEPPDAYIQYMLTLPNNGDIYISSIQLIVQEDEFEPTFIQDSIARQIDHTFNYYSPQLKYKPIPSILTGWDFAINPYQLGVSGTITTSPDYIADQLICGTSVSTVDWALTTGQGTLGFLNAQNNQAFFMMQYLEGENAVKASLAQLAMYLNVLQVNHAGTICRVYLYYNNGNGTFPTLPTTIGSINADGTFSLTPANGWSAVPIANGFSNNFTIDGLNVINEKVISGISSFSFLGLSTIPRFAAVVTFYFPTAGTNIGVNAIGLMNGSIATFPAPQTTDQVLKECQFYYERSRYVTDAQNTLVDSITAQISSVPFGGNVVSYAAPFGFSYKNIKRAVPNFTTLSTMNATSGFVTLRTFSAGAGTAVVVTESDKLLASAWTWDSGLNYLNAYPLTNIALSSVSAGLVNYNAAAINFQYILDARIGKF